jgi:hypothetical protein
MNVIALKSCKRFHTENIIMAEGPQIPSNKSEDEAPLKISIY